jgi:hypothetical protein
MRLPILSLLILLPIAAAAQPEGRFDEGWSTLHLRKQQPAPGLGQDELFPTIRFDMERAAMMEWAASTDMRVTDENDSSAEFTRSLQGVEFRMTIGFAAGRARSLSFVVTSADTLAIDLPAQTRNMMEMLAARAQLIDTGDGFPVYFHTTSQGVPIRTVIRMLGPNRLLFEAMPAERGIANLPPPKSDPPPPATVDPYDLAPTTTYGSDEFLPGIAVDMSRQELELWAVAGDWSLVSERSKRVEYELVEPWLRGRLAVAFARDRGRSISLKIMLAPEASLSIDEVLAPIVASLGARAQSKERKGARRTFLHTTSDGRKVRTVVDRNSDRGFTIESGVVGK